MSYDDLCKSRILLTRYLNFIRSNLKFTEDRKEFKLVSETQILFLCWQSNYKMSEARKRINIVNNSLSTCLSNDNPIVTDDKAFGLYQSFNFLVHLYITKSLLIKLILYNTYLSIGRKLIHK